MSLLSLSVIIVLFGGSLSAPSTAPQPPCPESDSVRTLLKRLSILEKLVRDIKGQCSSNCCSNVQSGADDPSLKPPDCVQPIDDCPGGCGGDARGTCVDGQCQCKDGYMGDKCQLKTCPEDCNDQGRCVKGRCICFKGFSGVSCGFKACSNNCNSHGQCEDGVCICDSGFTGEDCSSRTCPRNCMNQGKCEEGVCVCHSGFSGPDCATRTCRRNCLNRGRCEDGVCVCPSGFSGEDCSVKGCPNNCQGRGDCEDGVCVCDTGFTGPDCGIRTCLNDCKGNGRCEDGVCVCDSGFYGEDCSYKACPEDCNEQGQCIAGKCICEPGFVGLDCGIRVCSEECEKRGRCEDGECICNPGFTGPDCDIRTCPNDCNNQGQCNDGQCICYSGYTGVDCKFRSCPNKCNNRGRCEDGVCICNSGFSGPDCGSKACPKNCSGNGQCNNGKCICNPGFAGPVCGIKACPAECTRHGRCVRGTCICSPGYTGVDCSIRTCPKNCHDRGRCEGGVCFCESGYTGLDCGTKTCPNNCYDRGHCEDGACICDYGFTGEDCGTRTCPNDCHNQGRCDDGVCICEPGYTGQDCQSRTCPNDCHRRGKCEDGKCVCDLGYTGLDCGSRTCPKDCNNQGRCEDGQCICDSGYTGTDCGARTCPDDCNDRGTCDDGKCVCYQGYSGPYCESRACPNDCHKRGYCDDGICQCDPGYTDIDCGLKTCLNECSNQGQCDDGVCTCDSGYTGPDCSSRTCPENCHNQGRCDDGKCVCNPGFSGWNCGSRTCPDNCRAHGRCEDGVCVCSPGYTGPDCGSKACPRNCNNNGQCVNGKCVCNAGYIGPVCGAKNCPGNCNGRGKCTNGVCVCKKGFSGPDCSLEATEVYEVTGLRVISQEESAVTLEWDQPQSTPDSYDIILKAKKENGAISNNIDGSLTTYRQTGLAPGEEYVVNIQPRKGSTLGPETSVTAKTKIETPRGFRVVEVTSSALLLRWDKPQSLPDRYIVTLILQNGKERKLRVAGKGDRIKLTGLDEGTEYRVLLRAEKGQEQSQDTETTGTTAALPTTSQPHIEVTTQLPYTTEATTTKATKRPPLQMGGLQVQDVTSNSVILIWKAKPRTYESFLFRYEDVTENLGPRETTVTGNQREVTLQDLSQNTRYVILLYGIQGGKLSGPLQVEVTTDSSPDKGTPPRLSPLSVSEVQPNSFRVTWEPLDGDFDAYVLQYGPPGGPSKEETLRGDETTTLITGLVAEINYTVELRGVWGDSYSEPETTFVFTEKPKPPRLESLSVSDVRSDSVHLTWNVLGGDFDSFLLNYRDGEGQPREVNLENDLRSYDVKELKPGKKYKFFLYGLTGEKKSKPVTAETSTVKTMPPRLESLSVSDVYSESLRLSWEVTSGEFDGFLLMYRDAEGNPKEVTLDKQQRSIEVENLKPKKKYKFTLYGISGGKKSKPSIAEATTAQRKVAPSAPSFLEPRLVDLVASDVTQETITLSWRVEGNVLFDSIVVQCRDPDGRIREITIAGEDTSTIVQGLLPASRYECNVYGLREDKRSMPISIEVTTARILETQGPPTYSDLYLSPHGPHAIHVSWEAPERAFDSYIVEYAVQGQEESLNTVRIEGTERTVLLQGLQPDTVYTVKLHRILSGEEDSNLEGTGKTGPLDLEPPRELRFTNIAETSAVVSWDSPNRETTLFKVSYQLADGGEPESISVVGTSTPLKRLIPGTHYEVTVVSVRGFEESQPLTDFFTTAGGGPRNLRATDVTEVSALMRWEAPTGPVDRYLVSYRAENIPLVTVPVSGDRTELPLTGLHPHTEYFVSVQSSQGSMTSSPTSTSFITSADTPRDLTASQVTARSALLTWKAPDAMPDGYLLTYQTPEGEVKEIRLLPHLSSFTLSQLNPSTQYRVQLKALRGRTSSPPISTSFTTGRLRFPYPRDCWEQRMNGDIQNGTYTIYLGGDREKIVTVFCDMETDGGGWTVFQRRMDGSIDFYRDWNDYRHGFGDLTAEFWLGNIALHQISSSGSYELRVDLRAGGESAYAVYDDFRVESEANNFRLRLGQYRGDAGDSMSYHNNMIFSTRDRDAQKRILPCAMSYRGAWWYRNCHYANLNGIYNNNKDHQGVNWKTWKGFEFSIPFTEMKMRPRGVGNRRRL
ncbi:tenascin-X isoform X3 [Hyla sarda]|uniref:tenascin-X isoform X3 n=1 Tax=Hyla sarda TaxID=327740 RepID=UPI0024C47083|nr:tenascin-X isoform X3 [Hyla sarda]